jgi:hypothetical protein
MAAGDTSHYYRNLDGLCQGPGSARHQTKEWTVSCLPVIRTVLMVPQLSISLYPLIDDELLSGAHGYATIKVGQTLASSVALGVAIRFDRC